MIDGGVVVQSVAEPAGVQAAGTQAAQAVQQQPQLSWLLLIMLTLAVFFVVHFVRALPWADAWKRRRPLSCDVCVSTWSGLALLYPLVYLSGGMVWFAVVHLLPAMGLSMLLLHRVSGKSYVWEDMEPPEPVKRRK